jgi:hypothetical protein
MLLKLCRTLFIFALMTVSPVHAGTLPEQADFSRLLDFIALESLEKPLVLFESSEGDFDHQLNQENMAYLNQNPDLLQTIQAHLKGDQLRWKLSASSKRLLIVPEQREEYAVLFEGYCRNAITYALKRIGVTSPFATISTWQGSLPSREQEKAGINAYLVHNIADEYLEEYVFFNHEEDRTKIKINLSNRIFTGRIGSYSSKLIIGENSRYEFVREPYTLWRNSARNPVNVLIAPIEETLHIILRQATETGIQVSLARLRPQKLDELEHIVNDWMAVEEAIVGGLVARLMPEIFEHLILCEETEKLSKAFAERNQHEQYRWLDRGIQIVGDIGLEDAIDLYRSDPHHFREILDQQPDLAAFPPLQPTFN